MKKLIVFMLALFMPVMLFAQDVQESIDHINSLTREYDPYQRAFSYDESSGKLKWVTKDGSVTCEADLLYTEVSVEPNGSNFYVKFNTNDESVLIDCNNGGPVKSAAITITSESVAHEIADEISYLCDYTVMGGLFDSSGSSQSEDNSGTSESSASDNYTPAGKANFVAAINNINNYTSLYDPYKRLFSFDPSTCTLKWVTSDGTITCEARISDISVSTSTSGNDYLVLFSCNDQSKRIACNYTGPTSSSAITLTNKTYADRIVAEIRSLPATPLGNAPLEGIASEIQRRIDRINMYTSNYDPYKRKFSFNPYYGLVNFVTPEGDISIDYNPLNVSVFKQPSGTDFYVTFQCLDNYDCIQSTYSGNTKITSITIKNSNIADQIIGELQGIAVAMSGKSTAGNAFSNVSGNSGWQSNLARINDLCKSYDPYIRTFYYDPQIQVITWINKDGDIICKANINKVTVAVETPSSDYSVMFRCKDGSNCIDCNYGGATSRSSITIKQRDAADQIVDNIRQILAGGGSKGPAPACSPDMPAK